MDSSSSSPSEETRRIGEVVVIRIEGIEKRYGDFQALKPLDLHVKKGEVFGFLGPNGAGKTTLAGVIARCFATAGMFVDDRVVTAGRAEFVAEYEGQTVARTRNFLISNLDGGVIFIDEAYGITQWNEGKPEGYGTEAVTAMVAEMQRAGKASSVAFTAAAGCVALQ